jgi:hypothetical protein
VRPDGDGQVSGEAGFVGSDDQFFEPHDGLSDVIGGEFLLERVVDGSDQPGFGEHGERVRKRIGRAPDGRGDLASTGSAAADCSEDGQVGRGVGDAVSSDSSTLPSPNIAEAGLSRVSLTRSSKESISRGGSPPLMSRYAGVPPTSACSFIASSGSCATFH